MDDRYADFTDLQFDRPAPGVLRITLDGPTSTRSSPAVHRQLADVWLTVDRDPDTKVAVLQGAGRAFSAGGSFELIDSIMNDDATRLQVLRETRDLVLNVINCSKPIVLGDARRRPSAPGWCAACWPTSPSSGARPGSSTATPASASPPATTAICWPLLCGMAKAKYYLLTCETMTGEEAERIGWSLCVDDDVVQDRARRSPSAGHAAQSAIRWTKHTLNHWYRARRHLRRQRRLRVPRLPRSRRQGGPHQSPGEAAPDFTGPASE